MSEITESWEIQTEAGFAEVSFEEAHGRLWDVILEKRKAGITSRKISSDIYDGLRLAKNNLIHPKYIEETKMKLKRLKTRPDNIIIDGISLKDSIKLLWPEINKGLEEGLSYQQIADTLYNVWGLTEKEIKRENLWRVIKRHHKPINKVIAEMHKKSKKSPMENFISAFLIS